MMKNEKQEKMEFFGIADKINFISQALGAMVRDGHNDYSKYGYITYEQLNRRLQNLLPEVGLALIPSIEDFEERTVGTGTIRTIIKLEIELIDTETKESKKVKWVGADQDKGGKSMSQAITEGMKRFEMKLFHVSSYEDDDPDGKTTTGEDPIAWASKMPDIRNKCAELKLKKSQIHKVVTENNFEVESVLETLNDMGNQNETDKG